LAAFIANNKAHLGMVALDAPLISNLEVWANIALVRQYHRNSSGRDAEQEVTQYLRRFHLESIKNKRNSALTDKERFCVMLIRAAMVDQAVVVIDRPAKIMPDMENSQFIYDALEKIDDLFNECYIFDYIWHKDRY
jgi:ABC-type lipoprotein export system ATPase subunit